MFLELLQAVTGIFVVVYDGQHALKFTLGRAKSVVPPGIHFKLPIVQTFRTEETKHTTLDLEPQVIQLKDDLVYEVDAKVVYQIVNLRKAIIEIDDLVTGLQNRVVLAVQTILRAQDRESIKDTQALSLEIQQALAPVEEQWGVRILQFGFSNISPSPATLEITQMELLAREKLRLFGTMRTGGLGEEAAVALLAGAVVSLAPDESPPSRAGMRREEEALSRSIDGMEEERLRQEREQKNEAGEQDSESADDD
ncbi:MAG: SPFH domain-containing protein [Planctomycetota bacterium]|jgi:regulator of protease activity HflC (stomatin/prohibitin superfamily)|nr:membrane protease subunit, stomatin/prohibitin [Planctomycetota bacterium]MDP6369720.1 SPFH domain-containing protein [Planctomycetota bacterium]MDP6518308.1 SPFH domain-containing protein [Planctomycetota bacterium]MDP6837744.1 SPFH domain-containing protein [Planctomycetota bacterium]MDP6955971.1 SPFH domain-containing protein [Planctomycetota bacterium]